MKKMLTILLIGLFTLVLAACGSGEGEPKTNTDDSTNGADTNVTEDVINVEAGDKEFTITATNWEFTTDKELIVKKGDKVTITLVNNEGMHAIGNDELGLVINADEPVEFTADKVGEFELLCSIICGPMDDHDAMKITLKVVE